MFSVSCTIHALGLRCVALQVVGRKRRMQMKYGLSPLSVWLSPTLLAPLLFSVAPLPLSQPAAGPTSVCTPTLSPRSSFNQANIHTRTHAHKHLYPPPPSACISCCSPVQEMLTSEDSRHPVNRICNQNGPLARGGAVTARRLPHCRIRGIGQDGRHHPNPRWRRDSVQEGNLSPALHSPLGDEPELLLILNPHCSSRSHSSRYHHVPSHTMVL